MDEHMNHAPMASVLCACSCAVALTFAGFAFADNLPDPTLPPASIGRTPEGPPPAPGAAAPVLQSVLISPTRRVAIINGQTVKQGDKIGDARVVRITEGTVVLRSDKEMQTLKLFPGIEKQRSAGRADAAPGTSGDNKGR